MRRRINHAPWAVPSSDDRNAALILLSLAAAGILIRGLVGGASAPGAVAYREVATSRPGRDSVAERAARLARPLGRGETIDVDVAPASELARLPRIGAALAARIVAQRDEHGPFGSLEALDRVSGVGPAVLQAVRRLVVEMEAHNERTSGLLRIDEQCQLEFEIERNSDRGQPAEYALEPFVARQALLDWMRFEVRRRSE